MMHHEFYEDGELVKRVPAFRRTQGGVEYVNRWGIFKGEIIPYYGPLFKVSTGPGQLFVELAGGWLFIIGKRKPYISISKPDRVETEE